MTPPGQRPALNPGFRPAPPQPLRNPQAVAPPGNGQAAPRPVTQQGQPGAAVAPGNRPVPPQMNAQPGVAPGSRPPQGPPPPIPPQRGAQVGSAGNTPPPQMPPNPGAPQVQAQPVVPPVQPQPVQPPPPISATPVIAQGQGIGTKLEGKVKPGQVASKLTQDQRVWSDNVMRALKLKSKSSQTRVLAGAIASNELIQRDTTRSAQDKQSAQAQLKVVRAAGDPPWKDTRKAMAATAAKVELDLLSIPGPRQINRRVPPQGQQATAMQTYFLQRKDADGNARNSFVIKPATKQIDANGKAEYNTVAGIPNGGEVVREALSGRAAQTFMSQTGLDLNMPESHVISLDPALLPGVDTELTPDGKALCSVQEFNPGCREFRDVQANPQTRIPVDREQVAALAVFDLMTLNTDRHGGNIMVDPAGKLIPIDHGGSFPDVKDEDGRTRLMGGLGGGHNALLGLPEAHEPLSPATRKKICSMKSSDYGDSLRKDKRDIAAVHPGVMQAQEEQDDGTGSMQTVAIDAMPDASIDLAQMAARFAKLAARSNPPLSPAGMQIAFANNTDLLQPAWQSKTFDSKAKEVIAAAVQDSVLVKQVCLSQGAEMSRITTQLSNLGWWAGTRGAPGKGFYDPSLIMAIYTQSPLPRAPQGGLDAQIAAARGYLAGTTPADRTAALMTQRRATITAVIAALPAADRAAATAALNGLAPGGDQALTAATALLGRLIPPAVAEQLAVLQTKIASGVAANHADKVREVRSHATVNDPVEMAKTLARIV